MSTLFQVLDLPGSVVTVAPSPSEQPASAYKAAVDHFIQNDGGSRLTPQDEQEASHPDVQESHTQSLQQLIGSAKTLTAREDLLSTLRSDRTEPVCLHDVLCFSLNIFMWENTPPVF